MNFKYIIAKEALKEELRRNWHIIGGTLLSIIAFLIATQEMDRSRMGLQYVFVIIMVAFLFFVFVTLYESILPFFSKTVFRRKAEVIREKYVFCMELWKEFVPDIDTREDEVKKEMEKLKTAIAWAYINGGAESIVKAKRIEQGQKDIMIWSWNIFMELFEYQKESVNNPPLREKFEDLKKAYFEVNYRSGIYEGKVQLLSIYFEIKKYHDMLVKQMS